MNKGTRRNPGYTKGIILKKFESINVIELVVMLMFTLFPLLVIPNRAGYFYFPRYILLAVLGCVCLYSLYKKFEKRFLFVYIPLIIYIVCLAISTITANDIGTALHGIDGNIILPVEGTESSARLITTRFTGLITIILCVVLFFAAYKVDNKIKLLKYLIVTASIIGLVALFQHFHLNVIPHESFRDNAPPYGTIGQHNFLATFCVFIVPASIYLYLKEKKMVWLLCSVLIYTGMFVSTTRGSWIAFGISMIVMTYYYLKNPDYRKRFFLIVAILAIVSVLLMLTNDGALYSRLSTVSQNVSDGLQLKSSAGSNRMSIWKQVIPLIFEHWSFGVGPDNLVYYGVHLGNAPVDKAHNIYLDLAVSAGMPALLSYLVFLSYFIFRRWKSDKTFLFFIMIFTYLIQGFFNIDVIMVLPLFWIVLGMSLSNIQEEK